MLPTPWSLPSRGDRAIHSPPHLSLCPNHAVSPRQVEHKIAWAFCFVDSVALRVISGQFPIVRTLHRFMRGYGSRWRKLCFGAGGEVERSQFPCAEGPPPLFILGPARLLGTTLPALSSTYHARMVTRETRFGGRKLYYQSMVFSTWPLERWASGPPETDSLWLCQVDKGVRLTHSSAEALLSGRSVTGG